MGTKSVLDAGSEEDGIGFMGFKNNNKTSYKFVCIFVSPNHRALEILNNAVEEQPDFSHHPCPLLLILEHHWPGAQ